MIPGLAPRRIAHDVLVDVETRGAFADAALGRRLADGGLPVADRGLATRLAYGVLAWQRRLDWITDHWSKPKAARLDPEVRAAIRLGLFQIFFSDRIPDHAAVTTSVELVAGHRGGGARGLVNAVLRRAIRENAPEPPAGNTAGALGLRFSHPDWLVERWLEELGVESTARLLATNQGPAPYVLRASRRAGGRDAVLAELHTRGIDARATRFSPEGVLLETSPSADLLAPTDRWIVQGESSQLVARLVAACPGARILDVCAAPGGKTAAMADLGDDVLPPVAADASRSGISGVRELCRLAGTPGVDLLVADGARAPFIPASFDRILVDAPCTGTGTLRQHPEIRWRLSPTDVRDLARRQQAILAGIAPTVRPGGVLVYATCSLLRDENDGVVEAFLSDHGDFRILDASSFLPEAARPLVAEGRLRTNPARHGLDGFFAAVLLRSVA